MKIRIAEYPEGSGVAVHEEYDPKGLELEFVDLVYTAPVAMEGTVEKGPDTLSFRGALTSSVEQVCGRCLKKVKGTVRKSFVLYYEIKDQDVIETIDDLREQLILDHDAVFLCREDCRGLCSRCGADLNLTACGCSNVDGDSALGSIGKIWKDKQRQREGE
jgi:uncharacterized protein